MPIDIVMCWSGGKDSAVALQRLRADPTYIVRGLLTTLTEDYRRISMHGVRDSLLKAQAAALELPLIPVHIPADCPNSEYEARMRAACERLRAEGTETLAFGDLFLADIRAYRERQCAEADMTPVFPIWGEPTAELAARIVAEGYRATLCTVDPRQLDGVFAGRAYDADLLHSLPEGVDPCGENGEFHTFVHDGPGFTRPVPVRVGKRVERDGFVFADLLPANGGDAAEGGAI